MITRSLHKPNHHSSRALTILIAFPAARQWALQTNGHKRSHQAAAEQLARTPGQLPRVVVVLGEFDTLRCPITTFI